MADGAQVPSETLPDLCPRYAAMNDNNINAPNSLTNQLAEAEKHILVFCVRSAMY